MNDFIENAISDAGLEMQVNETEADLYMCKISNTLDPDVKWQRNITMKAGYGAPTLGNVLYYYALRAQEVSQTDDVLEWARETERDLNHPKTLANYGQLVQDKTDLRLLLSEPVYQKMMAGLEISQAIGNAGGYN